jgi:hypothetical protein
MTEPNAATRLRTEYEAALAELQANCKHELGEPMEYYWAPAHSAGKRRWCIHCNKMFGVNGESLDKVK